MARGGYRKGAGRKPGSTNRKPKAPAEPKVPAEVKPSPDMRRITASVEELMRTFAKYNQRRHLTPLDPSRVFALARPMKGVVPEADTATMLAMDEALTASVDFAAASIGAGGFAESYATEGLVFLGYPYLSELAQRPEYRVMAETIADDATRRWIGFDVTGDDTEQADKKRRQKNDPKGEAEREADPDEREKRIKTSGKLDKIKMLRDDQDRLDVKTRFYEMCRGDNLFGRMHLFIDLGAEGDELAAPIGNSRDEMSKAKVGKGSLKALRAIEPVWTYPQMYNAINPLAGDWYNPQEWYVMGQRVHVTRLQKFIGHPVPDLLKPAYSFGGLSMTQMAKPYVDIWLQTRQSVADLIKSFSVMVLKTDLQTILQSGTASDLLQRMMVFNLLRDNQGAFVVNKNTEDFSNVSTPISGLHELQAQAQEHMCVQAGVLIRTGRGDIPIEEVTASDTVLTRNGLSPVKWVGITGYRDTLVEIEAGGSVLRVTEEHPVWSQSIRAFVDAKDVSRSHYLLGLRSRESMARALLGEDAGGEKPKRDISATRRPVAFYIASSRKRTAVLFLKALKFTTSMVTVPTINSIISKWSRVQNTWREMAEKDGDFLSVIIEYAISAVIGFCPLLEPRYSVAGRARSEVTRFPPGGFRSDLMTWCAPNAAAYLKPSASLSPSSVLLPVCNVPVTRVETVRVEMQSVYNIEVEGLPEFFANGILVHNSSVSRIPLVKLTGISPSGLNATSEQEIEVYDDTIGAYQERFMRPNLERIINFQQLSLFGEIDPEITWHFEGLRPMTEEEKGKKQKDDADRDEKYVNMGAIAPEEVRHRIIDDPDLPYADLDPDDVPDLLDEESQGLQIPGTHPSGGEGDEPEKSDDPMAKE